MMRTRSWQCPNNQYAYCPKCNKLMTKRDVNAIKVGHYNPHILCYLCEECFASLLDWLGVEYEEE